MRHMDLLKHMGQDQLLLKQHRDLFLCKDLLQELWEPQRMDLFEHMGLPQELLVRMKHMGLYSLEHSRDLNQELLMLKLHRDLFALGKHKDLFGQMQHMDL